MCSVKDLAGAARSARAGFVVWNSVGSENSNSSPRCRKATLDHDNGAAGIRCREERGGINVQYPVHIVNAAGRKDDRLRTRILKT